MSQVESITRNKPQLNFTDVINYKIKGGSTKQLKFMKNEKCTTPVVSGGRCQVATGLPKETDTSPKLPEVKPFTGGSTNLATGYSAPVRGGGSPIRGGGGPVRGGGGPQRGGPQMRGGPPRGGGAPPPSGGGRGKPQCKALYDFNAENNDELTFSAGNIIEIVAQDGDWWTGTCDGRTGLFPGTYVELVGSSPVARGGPPPARGQPRGGPVRGGPPRGGPRGGPPRGMAPRGGPGRGY